MKAGKLNRLFDKVCEVCNTSNEDDVIFKERVKIFVFDRIGAIVDQAEHYIFEEKYVETTWKEMVSMHYVNTTYLYKPYVARIHFFNTEDKMMLDENHYLGYITIRIINEPSILLSSVVPNFSVFRLSEPTAIMFYKREVHVEMKTFHIKTFDFFAQDGVVASCINADILMFTQFLNKVYGYGRVTLTQMNEGISYPNPGLGDNEVMSLLKEQDIPVSLQPLRKEASSTVKYKKMIKSYVQSELPVILGFNGHVVIVIGITKTLNEDYKFVIYDDSGYFTASDLGSEMERVPGPFLDVVPLEKIETALAKDHNSSLIVPLHQRVYTTFPQVAKTVQYYVELLDRHYQKNLIGVETFSSFQIEDAEYLIVEISALKEFINQNRDFLQGSDPEVEKKVKDLMESFQPHYMWCAWLSVEEENILIVIDPTKIDDGLHMPYHLSFAKNVDFENLYGNLLSVL